MVTDGNLVALYMYLLPDRQARTGNGATQEAKTLYLS